MVNRKDFYNILSSKLGYATGCTEPAAIALCGAYAREYLKEDVQELEVNVSVNIIKNAMSPNIPGTTRTGIDIAAAIGAVNGNYKKELLVMDGASKEEIDKAVSLVDSGKVKVNIVRDVDKLYIEIKAKSANHTSKAIISGAHTNLVYAMSDDEVIVNVDQSKENKKTDIVTNKDFLTIDSILEFVDEIDRKKDDLKIIEDAIKINTNISNEGLKGEYYLSIGKNINKIVDDGFATNDMVTSIVMMTSAGIDARMGGANFPVVTNSGSGNQGITCTIPSIVAGKYLNKSEDEIFKAVTLSHLMCIYIHRNFGLLSALCGATIASTASSCAITYLLGGRKKEISASINNMLGSVTGMLCDGAKPDCALKVATCCYTACISAFMAIKGISIKSNEGIVEANADNTIDNLVKISDKCSTSMDDVVLNIMLNKKNN